MLRIFAFIQKGFPQLSDKYTAVNSDLVRKMTMKKIMIIAACMLLLGGCSGKGSSGTDSSQASSSQSEQTTSATTSQTHTQSQVTTPQVTSQVTTSQSAEKTDGQSVELPMYPI